MDGIAGVRFQEGVWSEGARSAFLAVLALKGDAARAAAAVGQTPDSAYALRRDDAAFAEAWREARNAVYARLEDELLARAIDASAREIGTFDQALALKMLARHDAQHARPNATRETMPRAASMKDIEQALLAKLAAFGSRLPETA